jgi:hypothetical protein
MLDFILLQRPGLGINLPHVSDLLSLLWTANAPFDFVASFPTLRWIPSPYSLSPMDAQVWQ